MSLVFRRCFFLMTYKWFPMCKVSSHWELSVFVISWWIMCYEGSEFPMYKISAYWELSVSVISWWVMCYDNSEFPMYKISAYWELFVSVIRWWVMCYESSGFPMYKISSRWELSVCPIGNSCFVSMGQCQSNAGGMWALVLAWLRNVTDGYEKRGRTKYFCSSPSDIES